MLAPSAARHGFAAPSANWNAKKGARAAPSPAGCVARKAKARPPVAQQAAARCSKRLDDAATAPKTCVPATAAAIVSENTKPKGASGSARDTVGAHATKAIAAAASTIAAPAVTTAPRTLLPPLVSRGNSKKRPRPASASPPHNGASPRTGASAVDTVRPAATSATKALINNGALLSSQRRYNTSDRAPLNKAASVVDRPILRMVSRRQSAGQLW